MLAILHVYLTIFLPKWIPGPLRVGTISQPFNLLVLGVDTTYNSETKKPMPELAGRTDTIMLVHLDPIHNQFNTLSIPRDTYTTLPGFGQTKINAANVYGGTELALQAITNLTGVKINYFITFKPSFISQLVDLLGGVYLEVEKDMEYVDHAQGLNINLKKGYQKLSGKQAHDYIRYRHDLYGDLGRIERQQKFMKALGQRLSRPSNIIKAPFIIYVLSREIKTNLPLTLLIKTVNWRRMLSAGNIRSTTLPGEPTTVDGAGSVVVPDPRAIEKLRRELFQ